jgi:uncharacterized membrane protein
MSSPSTTALPSDTDRHASGWWFLGLAVALFVGARVMELTKFCLNGDEIFSLVTARLSISELLAAAIRDVSHPPLFYLLLKGWIAIGGESLFWLRMLPVLISVATLIPLHLICRERKFSLAEESAVILLFAVNELQLRYAQQLRMFSLLEFFAVWSIWAFLRLLNRPRVTPRGWITLFLINLGMVYSHYWGWFVLGSQFLILLVLSRPKALQCFGIGILLLIAFSPWAIPVYHTVRTRGMSLDQISWIERPTLKSLVMFASDQCGTLDFRKATTIGLLLFSLPPLVFVAKQLFRSAGASPSDRRDFAIFAGLALIPVLATFSVSNFSKVSVWGPRHLVFVAIPYGLMLILSLRSFQNRMARGTFTAALLAWSIAAGIQGWYFSGPREIAWDQIVAHIREVENGTEVTVPVATLERYVAKGLDFHANDGREKWLDAHILPSVEEVTGRRLWFAFRESTWDRPIPPQEILKELGYTVGEQIQRTGRKQVVIAFPISKQD